MWHVAHVGTPSHLGHMDQVAATMPSQAHAGAAQEAPDIGQWEGEDVPLVRPSSCNLKGGILSSRRYLPTYLKTLRSAMEKPMGGPAEALYAPLRVDPGVLPFVPMFSESIMLGEHTAPAGSMRERHVSTEARNLTVQMSHAAQDPPATTTAHAVYAEEEIQSQTMQGRTMGSADGHG